MQYINDGLKTIISCSIYFVKENIDAQSILSKRILMTVLKTWPLLLLRASLTSFSSGTNPLAFICWRSSLKTTINLGFLGVWGLSFGFEVWGFGVRVSGFEGVSGFGVRGGFRVPGLGLGAWFRVSCSWFGLGFRVYILRFTVLEFMFY